MMGTCWKRGLGTGYAKVLMFVLGEKKSWKGDLRSFDTFFFRDWGLTVQLQLASTHFFVDHPDFELTEIYLPIPLWVRIKGMYYHARFILKEELHQWHIFKSNFIHSFSQLTFTMRWLWAGIWEHKRSLIINLNGRSGSYSLCWGKWYIQKD